MRLKKKVGRPGIILRERNVNLSKGESVSMAPLRLYYKAKQSVSRATFLSFVLGTSSELFLSIASISHSKPTTRPLEESAGGDLRTPRSECVKRTKMGGKQSRLGNR